MDRMEPVVVAHHVWHHGGETKVALDTLRAMCYNKQGEVYVAASTKPTSLYEELIQQTCAKNIYVYFPFRIDSLVVAQRSLLWRVTSRIITKLSKRSIVWIDNSAYGPLTRYRFNSKLRIIEYIHFPYEILLLKNWDFLPNEIRREVEDYFAPLRSNRIKWRYIRLAIKLESKYHRGNPFDDADVVLTTSEWVAQILRYLYGGYATPHQPAVDIREFSPVRNRRFDDRTSMVIAIGRISPEKRYEDVITAAAKSETRPKITIIGGLTKSKLSYFRFLKQTAKRLGVSIKIVPNAPRDRVIEELGKARVYVHAARGEHFGITVIEAMAAGVPVIVHRSGGPYYDIIRRGEYGLYYQDIQDLAENIDKLVSNRIVWNHYSRVASQRSEYYSYERFREQLARILEDVGIL